MNTRAARAWACLLLAICAVGCGDRAPGPTAQTTPVAANLLELGDVSKDDQGRVTKLSLRGAQVTDKLLERLGSFPELRELTLQECPHVSDAGLRALEDHPALQRLSLIRVAITDQGLQHVAKVSRLQELLLAHTAVTGPGIQSLSELPLQRLAVFGRTFLLAEAASLVRLTQLRELELDCPASHVADLPDLSPLTELTSLIVSRTPLGAGGWRRLATAAHLRHLVAVASDVNDEELAVLSQLQHLEHVLILNGTFSNQALGGLQLPRLKSLSLNGCKNISDEGLHELSGLVALEELDVCDTSVHGRDFSGLTPLKHLRKVTLTAAQFQGDQDSIGKLKQALPQCEVQLIRG